MKIRLFNALLTIALTFGQSNAVGQLLWNSRFVEAEAFHGERDAKGTFTFRNSSNAPISISAVYVDCGCVSKTIAKSNIDPGESGSITFSVDVCRQPTQRLHQCSVITDDANAYRLYLLTRGTSEIQFNPTRLAWAVGTPIYEKQLRIDVAQDSDASIEKIDYDGDKLSVSVINQTAKTCILSVRPIGEGNPFLARIFVFARGQDAVEQLNICQAFSVPISSAATESVPSPDQHAALSVGSERATASNAADPINDAEDALPEHEVIGFNVNHLSRIKDAPYQTSFFVVCALLVCLVSLKSNYGKQLIARYFVVRHSGLSRTFAGTAMLISAIASVAFGIRAWQYGIAVVPLIRVNLDTPTVPHVDEIARPLDGPAGEYPQLVVDHPVHDFGQVIRGRQVFHKFRIRNVGNGPLVINSIRSEHPGLSAIANKRQLAANESTEVYAQFDLSMVEGIQDGRIYVESNDPAERQRSLYMIGYVGSERDDRKALQVK
jgi:hypothetical protein